MILTIRQDEHFRIMKTLSGFIELDTGSERMERVLEKAVGHKYIRKVPKKSGKGFYYMYAETFKKPFTFLKTMFNIHSKKIDDEFEKESIAKNYGVDKQTYAAHVLEYLTNRLKWDGIFSKKESREKYKTAVKKPVSGTAEAAGKKQPTSSTKQSGGEKTDNKKETTSQTEKKAQPVLKINRSLMYKVWSLYNKQEKSVSVGDDDGNKIGGETVKEDLKKLTAVLETGKSSSVRHKDLGEIIVDVGNTGKSGYGLKHIIEQRYSKDGKNEDEITALLQLVIDATKNGTVTRTNERTIEVSKNGIVAILRRENEERNTKWILTGFADWNKDKEATDAIQTVIAQYSYTPEFSSFRKQVGAVTASLQTSIPQSGTNSNRSEAMKGNQNAKKDFAAQEKERAKKNEARKKEGLPQTELFERESALKDATWDPNSEQYRYRDTGYIAGSRKELAQNYIKQMAKAEEQILEHEIDWEGLEENPRSAKELIKKSNVFGKVNFNTLIKNGMARGAAFLIDRVYASVATEAFDNPEGRHNYVIAINGLRGRLEDCKTVQDVIDTINEINDERQGVFLSVRQQQKYLDLKKEYDEVHKKKHDIEMKETALMDKLRREKYGAKISFTELEKTPEIQAFQKANGWDSNVDVGDGKTRSGYFEKERVAARERLQAFEKEANEKAIASNSLYAAWNSLGNKFIATINYSGFGGSATFEKHIQQAKHGNYDNWEWKETGTLKGKRSAKGKGRAIFQLIVASKFSRKGGRNVKAHSTEELKKMFNLRDIQSGNWVLKDPMSAKFHVDHACEAFADLADITGIPDSLISLNGRLALAIGSRGKSKAEAHYEHVERVINLTKMKGGGNLAHEWFHAFDNLISEAMVGGKIDVFLTNPMNHLSKKQQDLLTEYMRIKNNTSYSQKYKDFLLDTQRDKLKKAGITPPVENSQEEHVLQVRTAFDNLVKAMTEGNTPIKQEVEYSSADYKLAKFNFDKATSGLAEKIRYAGSLEKAIELAHKFWGIPITKNEVKQKNEWIRMICAYYGNAEGGRATIDSGKKGSAFHEDAKALDRGKAKPYWSAPHEMAARAFSAYIDDMLKASGRKNDYLAYATENDDYDSGDDENKQKPYPEGEERKKINAAFKQLFDVVKQTGAIRKAIAVEQKNTVKKNIKEKIRYILTVKVPVSKMKKSFEEGEHPRGEDGRFTVKGDKSNNAADKPVIHSGEYVLTSSGRKDFGEITEDIAKQIRRQAGKIRLRIGKHITGEKDNFGEKHIERTGRLKDLANVGFTTARDFVEYVCNDFDAIYENGRSLILYKRGDKNSVAYVELTASDDGDFYDVKTIFPARQDFLKKKMPLWEKPINGIQKAEKERAQSNQFNEKPRSANFTGSSASLNIPQSAEKSSMQKAMEKAFIKVFAKKVAENIYKSLTYSGYPLQGRTKIHGMDISIENKKGSVRSGVDKDGHEWAIKMAYDYGYIRGTVGKDKDHVDAYIGNNPESEQVFIVHQNDPTTGTYDEDKVMLGFNSAAEAKAAYLRQYDRPGFFGSMDEMSIEEFKEKAFDKKNKGKMIA
ncbi:LPD1 domain-containing protein [Treponema phagedenis]|uniref:LPD1 domain-containing protein n=1 Tax=Treponema phagedenis TaxID=162 RepID=UPI0016531FCD|nr:LPD1 domain-containing protein [Treponema phagedenis]